MKGLEVKDEVSGRTKPNNEMKSTYRTVSYIVFLKEIKLLREQLKKAYTHASPFLVQLEVFLLTYVRLL